MSDFTPNKLGFDTKGCMTAIMRAADAYMSRTSDWLMFIMKKQIDINGVGSKWMKNDAKKMVREISHEVTEDHIKIEAGFDTEMARSMALDFYVRVMTVLFGNQSQGPLKSKPGRKTFRKHVIGPFDSKARTEYFLPDGFNFEGVSEHILNNTMMELEKYFKDMLDVLGMMFSGDFFGSFITGG